MLIPRLIPRISRSAFLAVSAGAVIATAATVVPALADGTSPPSRGAASFVATAPCSGMATISLTWTRGDTPSHDTLVARMTHGVAGAKWQVEIADYSGDTGSVGVGSIKANANGAWRSHIHAGRGHHRFEVHATSPSGQVCAVTLEGQQRPLN